MIKPKLLTASGGDTDLYIGEKEYLSPGTFQFQVPLGIRRIHACCIGAGAGSLSPSDREGGGAGSLCWANNIEVEPGETLTVQVGALGWFLSGSSSTHSFISRGNDKLMDAGGAKGRTGGVFSLGSGVSGGGGNGGDGGPDRIVGGGQWCGSGGGAGGYYGNGGPGVMPWTGTPQDAGAPDPGSGGGSGGTSSFMDSGALVGVVGGARGGGVGIMGHGADGAPTGNGGSDANARPGNPGSGGQGAQYGAGSAGESTSGGHGAVRIIWGIQYRYPDKATL